MTSFLKIVFLTHPILGFTESQNIKHLGGSRVLETYFKIIIESKKVPPSKSVPVFFSMLGVMRLQSSARLDLGLVNKMLHLSIFFGTKFFFSSNP